jgi:hypothetical protein
MQGAQVAKPFLANLALVRFVPGVYIFMGIQVANLGKLFVTLIAMVGLFAAMRSLMYF